MGPHTTAWTNLELFPTEDITLKGENPTGPASRRFAAGVPFNAKNVVRYQEHPKNGESWVFTVGDIRFQNVKMALFETAEERENAGIWSFLDHSRRRHTVLHSPTNYG
jgi:hypothetical protein